MKKLLAIHAVNDEYIDLSFADWKVIPIRTGVGKVKAAARLIDAIHRHSPDAVLNYGTAGSILHHVGDIFVCREFIDRDIQRVKQLGLTYKISLPSSSPYMPISQHWTSFTPYESKTFLDAICNTGDSFVTEAGDLYGDVFDMESYAEAWVCKEKEIPFVSVKFVTDIIGQNSVKHWEDKLEDARTALAYFFKNKQL